MTCFSKADDFSNRRPTPSESKQRCLSTQKGHVYFRHAHAHAQSCTELELKTLKATIQSIVTDCSPSENKRKSSAPLSFHGNTTS